MTLRDFWLFGEVVCAEIWTVTWYCREYATEKLFKRGAKVCLVGPGVPLS